METTPFDWWACRERIETKMKTDSNEPSRRLSAAIQARGGTESDPAGGATRNTEVPRLHRRKVIACGLALFASTLTLRPSRAAKPQKVALKISAGTAPVSLAEFVRQTGLQVLFDFDAIRNVTTREVAGQLDAAEALAQMFEGSGLMFEFINDRTIAVRRRPATATPAAQSLATGGS
jgi:hypothetical protein